MDRKPVGRGDKPGTQLLLYSLGTHGEDAGLDQVPAAGRAGRRVRTGVALGRTVTMGCRLDHNVFSHVGDRGSWTDNAGAGETEGEVKGRRGHEELR